MSLVIDPVSGDPIHYPKRRDVFIFDEEVTEIFDNMAVRSLPMYTEINRIHAELVAEVVPLSSYPKVLDIGASTGMLFRTICNQLQIPCHVAPKSFRGYAVDNSAAMLRKLKETFPWVITAETDIRYLKFQTLGYMDVVNMMYTLQFVEPQYHTAVLQSCFDILNPGGLFLLAHKESGGCDFRVGGRPYDSIMTDLYLKFRLDNGYTWQEIEAKTQALRNSMWPMERGMIEEQLHEVGFRCVVETTRWLQFASYMAIR